jgi:hypothetical protein
MWMELLIILALILANGIFAGAEIALITLRKSRLAQLVDEGRAGARSVLALRNEPERFLRATPRYSRRSCGGRSRIGCSSARKAHGCASSWPGTPTDSASRR